VRARLEALLKANAAPRCGARSKRTGKPCQGAAMPNGRCKLAKNGSPSVHPMQGDEIRALRRLQREQGLSSHVFMTERDGPMTPKAFHALFGRIGERAKMPFPVHPHMLRHGCGFALANAGHDTRSLQAWLGHKNIQHTVRYTEMAPDRFKDFWR
jgi:integrase